MVAVSDKYKSTVVPLIDDFYEQLLLNLKIGDNNIIIGAVYIPPSSNVKYYSGLIEMFMVHCWHIVVILIFVTLFLLGILTFLSLHG